MLILAGARGIEPRSKVLETFILTVVLCPCVKACAATSFCLSAKASAYGYAFPYSDASNRFAPWVASLAKRMNIIS